MVKTGPARRQSYPPTPVSPPPGSLAALEAHARVPTKPVVVHTAPVVSPIADEVHSAETASVAAVSDVRSRPTAAIDSGAQHAIGGGSKRKIPPAAIVAGVIIVGALGIMLSKSSGAKAPAAPAADTTSASAPVPTTAAAVDAALGDSVVVGHGPDATVAGKGGVPKTVSSDAVALLNISVAKVPGVGDTVRIRLDALDDNGNRVTSPQIVWATSNPRVLKFAGPGHIVGVKEGKATVTVSAGNTTGTHVVTVGPRGGSGAPAKRAKKP